MTSAAIVLACASVVLLVAGAYHFEEKATGALDGLARTGAAWRSWLGHVPWLLLIYGAFHFARLTHLSLSIDDESAALRHDPSVWLSQGRWAVYWFERALVPTPTVPFVPDFLLGLGLATAYVLMARLHARQFDWVAYLLFPLFAASPALLVLGEFYANAVSVGAGYVLVALALTAQHAGRDAAAPAKRWALWAVQWLCLAASIGCYQAFVLAYVAAGLGSWLVRVQREPLPAEGPLTARALVHQVACLGAHAAVGIVLYKALQALHVARLAPGTATPYIDQFFRIKELVQQPGAVATQFFRYTSSALLGGAGIYGGALPSFAALAAGSALAVGTGADGRAPWRRRALVACGFVAAVYAPFLLQVLTGGTLPLRCVVALPYGLWFIAWIACSQRLALLRTASRAAAVAAVLQLLVLSGQYGAEMLLAQDNDERMAAALYQDLAHSRPDFDLRAPYVLDIFGKRAPRTPLYPTAITSTTSASFFDWDEGNTGRMLNYMYLLGYSNVRMPSPEERAQAAAQWRTMPNWPAAGSIRWLGEMALIKLADAPGFYHRDLMAQQEPRP